ncbi:MAG: hypothetical protein ACFFER_07390 [Candidatus Thorarchaeota archaeon]
MVVEKLLIIGKTQPDWAKREGDIVSCTVGITNGFEWRRLRHAKLSHVRELRTFTWAEIDMVSPTGANRDPRSESRMLNRANPSPINVIDRLENKQARKWYIEQCVQQSVAQMQDEKKTLGIVKPLDLEFTIGKPKETVEDEAQVSLLDWFAVDDPSLYYLKEQIERKKEYASKKVEVRFQFRCGPDCETKRPHDMIMLDIELFMLFNNCSSRRDSFEAAVDCMSKRIEKEHRNKDVFLGLGTHRGYPFKSYMVGSAMRFDKGLSSKQPTEVW